MVTKAIILNRVSNSNTYVVRIPFLDVSGMPSERRIATLSTNPSIIEEYKVNDVVYVSFEEHKANKVVIIGKLYVGESEPRGHANLESLMVSNNVTLPSDTTIMGVKMSELITRIENLPTQSSSVSKMSELENDIIPVVAVIHTLLKTINNVELNDRYKTYRVNDYEFLILSKNNTKLDDQQARDYIYRLTGNTYLPVYRKDVPAYSYVFDDNYILYQLVYTEEEGLKALVKARVQPELISGVNIKTINNVSLLGSGNIDIGHIVGDYLPLSGGTLTGNLNFKPNENVDEQATISYTNSTLSTNSELRISNATGNIVIDSKYDQNHDATTKDFATIVDGVVIKALSDIEINNILYPNND